MKLIAMMADHPAKVIRNNVLKVLGEAYQHLGDGIWKVIGDVSPYVRGLFEGRFKKKKEPGLSMSMISRLRKPSSEL